MREHVTTILEWCDVCAAADPDARVEAVDSITFAVGGRSLSAEVCGDHKDPTWSTLVAVAHPAVSPASTRHVPRAARVPADRRVVARWDHGPLTCPVPKCHRDDLNGPRGVAVHLGRSHPDLSAARVDKIRAALPWDAMTPAK